MQPQEVQDIIKKYISRNAYHAHSENLLLALLASPDKEDRSFAVDKILTIRGRNEYGDESVRPRRTPAVNFESTCLRTMLFWGEDLHEPIFTCKLTNEEVKGFIQVSLIPPHHPIHSQSTERAVQEVSVAAVRVYGAKKRDG